MKFTQRILIYLLLLSAPFAAKATLSFEVVNANVAPNILERILHEIPKLPELSNKKIKLIFTASAPRDGLFVPPNEIFISQKHLGSNGLTSLLTHEVFHAIHYLINPDEEPWVREGMAQFFEFIVTKNLNAKNLQAAIKNPLTPLIGEYDFKKPNDAQYGHNLLYFHYLFTHCGGENLFWKISRGLNGLRGKELISTILDDEDHKEECTSFESSAISFLVAKNHNKSQYQSDDRNRYFVTTINLLPKTYNSKEAKAIIEELPPYSSIRVTPDPNVNFFQQNLLVFFAKKSFPFTVLDSTPLTLSGFDLILVKLP